MNGTALAGVFSCELDRATRPFNGPIPRSTERHREHLGAAIVRAAEALLLCESVAFKVYGENLVVAALVECFGLQTVETLLDSRALRFVLCRSAIGVPERSSAHSGLLPLAAASNDRAEYSEPLQSAAAGLRGWTSLTRLEVARLAPKVAANTIAPRDLAEEVVDRIVHAQAAGDLTAARLPELLEIGRIELEQLEQLVALAVALLDMATMLEVRLDLFDGDSAWQSFARTAPKLRGQRRYVDVAQRELGSAQLIDLGALFLTGAIRFEQLPDLRERAEAQAYRRWLWGSPDADDAAARAFVAMLVGASGSARAHPLGVLAAGLSTFVTSLGGPVPEDPPPLAVAEPVPDAAPADGTPDKNAPSEDAADEASAPADLAPAETTPPARVENPLDVFWIERLMRDRPRHLALDLHRSYEAGDAARSALRALPGVAQLPAHPGIAPRTSVRFRSARPKDGVSPDAAKAALFA